MSMGVLGCHWRGWGEAEMRKAPRLRHLRAFRSPAPFYSGAGYVIGELPPLRHGQRRPTVKHGLALGNPCLTDARDTEEERGEAGKLEGEAVDLDRNVHLMTP